MVRGTLLVAALALTACGRVGYQFTPAHPDAGGPVDGGPVDGGQVDGGTDAGPPMSDLCDAPAIDLDGNGVPDDCDPCTRPSAPAGCTTHGVVSGGIPNHSERVLMIALNAFRADPTGFRARYIVFGDMSGSGVLPSPPAPLPLMQYRQTLNAGAHFHAANRVTCAGSAQNLTDLCDATPYGTWVTPYLPVDDYSWYHLGPVPWAAELPWFVFGAMVGGCPVEIVGYASVSCPVNATPTAFLGATHLQMGTGSDFDGIDYTTYEFLVADGAPAFAYPAPTGGHFHFQGQIHFALNVDITSAPRGVYVVIDGVRTPMSVALGSATRAMYDYAEASSPACRPYYFLLALPNGEVWRYPGSGSFQTVGELADGCSPDWTP